MKLGEIKIEALKLMFVNYSFDIGIQDIEALKGDENYGGYIVNMNGAISRALDRIENACVLSLKNRTIQQYEFQVCGKLLRFDTSKIPNFFMIDRVIADYENGGYDGNASYMMEGDVVVLENTNASYTILYYPTVPTIHNLLDTDEIEVPERIARIIPYFIKGDLFQEEEPALASDARNIFEASLDDMKKQVQNKQNHIEYVFKM